MSSGTLVPSTAVNKAGAQLQKLVLSAVTDGVGPVSGSMAYAHSRLPSLAISSSGSDGAGGSLRVSGGFAGAGGEDAEAAIRRIIRESVAASSTSGFVTGLGGFVAMPVAIPANIAGSLVINARMVGAIAYLRGYALDDPHTQAMLMLVVAGSSAQSALSTLGVKVGQEVGKKVIRNVSIEVIRAINKKAGFYLVAKYGTKRAAITLTKFVPGIGGVVGGAVDGTLTRSIGSAAKKVFPAS